MPISFNWIDLLFIVTVLILVFNGFRNGFVASLINLIGLPLGFVAALVFGPQLTKALAANGLSITPFLAYIMIFFATVLVVHIVATVVRGFVQRIPVISFGDELLGAVIGFVEAWLLWLLVLMVLHNVLANAQNIAGITPIQFNTWQQTYNDIVTNSLFARVNSFMISKVALLHLK